MDSRQQRASLAGLLLSLASVAIMAGSVARLLGWFDPVSHGGVQMPPDRGMPMVLQASAADVLPVSAALPGVRID